MNLWPFVHWARLDRALADAAAWEAQAARQRDKYIAMYEANGKDAAALRTAKGDAERWCAAYDAAALRIENLQAALDKATGTPEMSEASARTMLESPACLRCGRYHAGTACRRVRYERVASNGDVEYRYWKDGEWDETQSVSPEDVAAVLEYHEGKRKEGTD